MKITCAFPGGNIVVERVEGDHVWLHQDLRDTSTDWFYWYFRITEAEGKEIHFHFTQSPALGARGPAFSRDGGATWHWLGETDPASFAFRFGLSDTDVLFSMTMPYLEADWTRFIAGLESDPAVKTGILCQSAQGRPVETLTFGNTTSAKYRVLLTCRHHACETMASYALEGWIAFVLSQEPEALWLRNNVAFLAIPFVDKDGCEEGDQGKNRRPHDHNRDYGDGLYPETVALRSQGAAWQPHVALDLHCPWLRSWLNESVYLVGTDRPEMWQEQARYSAILERVQRGPLPFRAADNLPFGQDWNTAESYNSKISCTRWAMSLPGTRLASPVEIPYANAGGVEVNPDTARRLGADLALACAGYLQLLE